MVTALPQSNPSVYMSLSLFAKSCGVHTALIHEEAYYS